eukprot:TRINITY_DN24268_c0_g1_i1.p1 TRINITY_DN24268_c0_g1~~TRINITY_DN24268_c0_g1_i1.p1  ORF type:complete len:226 (-),score=36.29 TRINITY_DN24268_c0_g1_i1:9-686(-)
MANSEGAESEIKRLIATKKTFLSGVKMLEEEILSLDFDVSISLLKRVFTLLNTRYVEKIYWIEGLQLFTIALSIAPEAHHDQLQQFVQRCAEETEGQSVPAPSEPTPPPLDRFDLDIQEQLESLLSESMGPPPASREARSDLQVVTVSEHDTQSCCVCQTEFGARARAQKMPCGHLFHYECLLEWLEKHNTCPVCRHSLPSERRHFDDIAAGVQSRFVAQGSMFC